MSTFADQFADAVADQLAVSQDHLAIAVWSDAQALPRLARYFYAAALSARNRALMLVQYQLDTGMVVRVPGVPEPTIEFSTPLDAVNSALARERASTQLFKVLVSAAREGGHLIAEHYLGWFLTTQARRTGSLGRLATTVERAQETSILLVETTEIEWALEEDSSAPRAAGGLLTVTV